jgi:acetyl esterase/lipase
MRIARYTDPPFGFNWPLLTRRALVGMLGAQAVAAASGVSASEDPIVARFKPFVNRDLWPYIREAYDAAQVVYSATTLPALRAEMSDAKPLAAPAWSERLIATRKDGSRLRVYLVNPGPPGGAPRPAILHIHGGGFVVGAARRWLPYLQGIAAALDCLIVTVDYRLAPETPFPGALEDNYSALGWLHANAAALGVDPRRLILMGESAGGGHAAMLAIAARDRGEIPIAYQMLIFPMLDDRTGSVRVPHGAQGALWWSAAQNRFGWSALLGQPAGSSNVPIGAVPARVPDLRRLPPTFIGVGSIDLFVDEDVDHARRLIDAGVATELVVVPGAFHGFINLRGARIVEDFRARQLAALRAAMAPP